SFTGASGAHPGVAANGLHINAYFGDVNGNGIIDPYTSASVTAASESGTTVTITAVNSFHVGDSVTITGITPTGYGGGTLTFANSTSFQYTAASGLGSATLASAKAYLNNSSLDLIAVNNVA